MATGFVAITASTGVAAMQIGGQTIHSWAGLGNRESLSQDEAIAIARNRAVRDRIRSTDVLIIDEVSMLSGELLDAVDLVCREARESDEPFGGLQVVLVGDFAQLAPVKGCFAFQSKAWQELNPAVCYLIEQHRTEDAELIELQRSIRRGHGDAGSPVLRSRWISDECPRGVPWLSTHNVQVHSRNAQRLDELVRPVQTFLMTAQGSDSRLVKQLKDGCQSPATLHLKTGAQVMFTKNDPDGQYANGTLGTVVDANRAAPLVQLRDGSIISAERVSWDLLAQVDDDEETSGRRRRKPRWITLARVCQVPLRLAWAMTVHKAQGMSLPAAVVDLTSAFTPGQGYVAISRVKTLGGLFVQGWNEEALRVHPVALAMDYEFRRLAGLNGWECAA